MEYPQRLSGCSKSAKVWGAPKPPLKSVLKPPKPQEKPPFFLPLLQKYSLLSPPTSEAPRKTPQQFITGGRTQKTSVFTHLL